MSDERAPSRVDRSDVGGLWEDAGFEIRHDADVYAGAEPGVKPCPHCYDEREHVITNVFSGHESRSYYWLCPRALVQYNEGGHCTTGTCLDCVLAYIGALEQVA